MAKLSSERIIRAAFLATSVPLPMAMPMSAALMAGASLTPSPVMATTSPFALRVSTSSTLCSGATRPITPMSSIRARRSDSDMAAKSGSQDGLATDPDLLGNGGPGGDVVAGDHPDPDVGRLGLGHCRLGLGPGGVHHPDQGGHLKLLDVGEQVALGIEPDEVEVTLGGGHDPLAGSGHALDVGLRPRGEVWIPRDRRSPPRARWWPDPSRRARHP